MSKSPLGPIPAALAPAEVLAGRYRVVSVLTPPGTSAVGATYTALDLAGGPATLSSQSGGSGQLTLRVLADPGSGGGGFSLSEDDRERFVQQAGRLSLVRHPMVARTQELGLLPELGVFLARESVESEGQTLRDVLAVRGGPLPEEEAVLLCAQIGEALDAAHLQGACHLGLSPSCIFVYPDGSGVRIKVADFGLLPPAWAARVGEAGYLAPEQVDGPLGGYNCDRRTDQFALAVILYEMLAGQPAFIAAADEDRRIILGRVRNEDPLPLAQSRGVEQALARALSRSRAVRFPTVRDFVRALGADVSRWPSALPAASTQSSGHSPRLLLPMAAGGLFALVCLGGGVAVWQMITRPPTPPERTIPEPPKPGSPSGESEKTPPTKPATPIGSAGNAPVPAAIDASVSAGDAPPINPPPNPPINLPANPPANPPVKPGENSDGGIAPDLAVKSEPKVPPEKPPAVRRGKLPPLRNNNVEPILPPAGALPMQFGGEENLLTAEQRAELTGCVKMISPQPPFEVWLQNINGILYPDLERSSPQFSESQDFRDCLKLRVKGKIVPKVLTITRQIRGKAAP